MLQSTSVGCGHDRRHRCQAAGDVVTRDGKSHSLNLQSTVPWNQNSNISVGTGNAQIEVNGSVISNGNTADTITVKVVDATGNVVSNFDGKVELSINSSWGTLSNHGTVYLHNGMKSVLLENLRLHPSYTRFCTRSLKYMYTTSTFSALKTLSGERSGQSASPK